MATVWKIGIRIPGSRHGLCKVLLEDVVIFFYSFGRRMAIARRPSLRQFQ